MRRSVFMQMVPKKCRQNVVLGGRAHNREAVLVLYIRVTMGWGSSFSKPLPPHRGEQDTIASFFFQVPGALQALSRELTPAPAHPPSLPSFSQMQVKAQLSDIALKEGNVTLPSNYTLIDVSFLDTIKPSESADLKTEEAFWAAQQAAGAAGQAGKLIHWRVNTQIILCCD